MNNDVNCAHHRIMSAFILQGDRAKEEGIKNFKNVSFWEASAFFGLSTPF
jgi:hypothetical protein